MRSVITLFRKRRFSGGLGGVGKSTLAIQYAWENHERYAGVWWLARRVINELAFENLEVREFDAGKWLLARGVPQGSEGTIDVEVQDRIVTLNGRVPGLPSKRLAGVLAWWVPGVRDVVNGIELDPPGGIETWMW